MNTQPANTLPPFFTTDQRDAKKWLSNQKTEFEQYRTKHAELVCPIYGAQYGEIETCDIDSNCLFQTCLKINSPRFTSPLYLTPDGFASAQRNWNPSSPPRLTVNRDASKTWDDQDFHVLDAEGWFQKEMEINCPNHRIVTGMICIIDVPNHPLPSPNGSTNVLKIRPTASNLIETYYLTGACELKFHVQQ